MLLVFMSALLANALITFIERVQKRDDGIAVMRVVLVPIAMYVGIIIIVQVTGLPPALTLLGYPLAFIVPLLKLRRTWLLSWGRSFSYSVIIVGSMVVSALLDHAFTSWIAA